MRTITIVSNGLYIPVIGRQLFACIRHLGGLPPAACHNPIQRLMTATGARWEAPGETGIAHFLEHMLFKGTLNRSVAEIARTMDALGGNLDAYTSKELVSYNVKVLAPHLPTAMDVLSDMVRNPLLAEEDIEKEKGVILEELKMEQDNPESFANDLFQ